MYSKGLTVYFVEKCDIIASVYEKGDIGKFMSVKDLTTYEVLKDEDLKGIKAKGKLLKHKKSGARVLLVENDDNNKVFSIAFRTPPSDSTGVPHIMEHSVLCGSKNFRQRIHL